MRQASPRPGRTATTLAAAFAAGAAQAVGIDLGESDWSLRFDNTVKAGLMARTQNADPALVNSFRLLVPGVSASAFPQALNFNAGDDNFRKRGLVSQRVDLLSEFDAVYRKDYGLRLSAATWYDAAYRGTTDAADPVNGQTPINEFPEHTRRLAGRKAEVLDAFVFGSFDLGDSRRLTTRLGRHALQYGESLFFGDNGIARAQGPIDILKLLGSPNAQFKEIIRPVPQLSAQFQVTPEVSVGGPTRSSAGRPIACLLREATSRPPTSPGDPSSPNSSASPTSAISVCCPAAIASPRTPASLACS